MMTTIVLIIVLVLFGYFVSCAAVGRLIAENRLLHAGYLGAAAWLLIPSIVALGVTRLVDGAQGGFATNQTLAACAGVSGLVVGYLSGAANARRASERSAQLKAQGLDPKVPTEQVMRLARDKRMVEAIKLYREDTGAALSEAKATIEAELARR